MNRGFKVWECLNRKMIENPAEEGIFLSGNGNLIKPKTPEIYLMNYFKIVFSTGLKDKNGKEIYEGDIIKHDYHGVSEVFMRNGGLKINGSLSVVGFGSMAKKSEVIGNKFENKELLK